MTIGLIGTKRGMTRIHNEDGTAIPVTVVEVVPNRVTRLKTEASDGYASVQVTYGTVRSKSLNRPEKGEFAKADVVAGAGLLEHRLTGESGLSVGDEIKVDIFAEGEKVDVTATSKGKGFAGPVKRWNFAMQDATHGNSLSHRAHGSVGQNQSPGRVFKGKKMAGQMGNVQRTQQGLTVVRVDVDRNLLLVKGAVPGHTGSRVLVKPSVKSPGAEG
ncbi:MAG: 50S ribosomal protein L3 [Gammaproteobacteria bacterium]|nr:50S ribosomal protein L3 [Gammaproteobacteria bacterium]